MGDLDHRAEVFVPDAGRAQPGIGYAVWVKLGLVIVHRSVLDVVGGADGKSAEVCVSGNGTERVG